MPKNVQIRNVDDATYALLRERAAAAGLSLTQFLRRELDQVARTPTMADWLDETDRWREHHGGVSREALDDAIADMRTSRK